MFKRDTNSLIIQRKQSQANEKRWGSIIMLSTGIMIMVFGFLAFTVDVGYIALTKAQLEAATDAGARAAVSELKNGIGYGATKTSGEAATAAKTAAVQIAAANRAGDHDSIFADPTRDVRLGQVVYDPGAGKWQKSWGQTPYNMVELTLHRDQTPPPPEEGGGEGSGIQNGDETLPLFFAPVIGHNDAALSTKGVAALLPGNGFRIPAGSGMTADILPFALDDVTWNALILNNVGEDNFKCHPDSDVVTSAPDGKKECNLYPFGDDLLPPGNRGTVDIGASGNSSSDIARQILHGISAQDIVDLGVSELKCTYSDPLTLNGDTGISAGFKDELTSIIGQKRCIPIFTGTPTGNGNNAMYTIVKFVGVQIVDVKLTGNPKWVKVQPCPYMGQTVTWDTTGAPIAQDTIFTTPVLIE